MTVLKNKENPTPAGPAETVHSDQPLTDLSLDQITGGQYREEIIWKKLDGTDQWVESRQWVPVSNPK